MSSPILRGLDLRIDRDGAGIAEVVRLVLNPIWNAFHFFTLYANADGLPGHVPHRLRPTCSTATCWPRPATWSRRSPSALDAYDLAGACARSGLPRRAQQLVHPPQPGPLLGAGRRRGDGRRVPTRPTPTTRSTRCSPPSPRSPPRCCRCSPRRSTPGSPASARVHLTDWPDADVAARRSRAGAGHGRGPRRLLDRPRPPRGPRAAHPAAAGLAHRRRPARRRARAVRRACSPTRST